MPFVPNPRHTLYHFETDLLSGTLQPKGHSHGIRKLIHKPTDLSLVHPDFSLLNLYLIFITGRCIASARAIQRTVTADADAVHIHWDATEQHRAYLSLTYRLVPPNAVDLHVTVRARDAFPAYEGLFAGYFDLALKPYIYVSPGDPYWLSPVVQHLYRDNALIFPRDAQTAKLHLDGRWANVRSIYRWKSQRYYARPLAMQIHPDHRVAVALLARPETCTAIAWTTGMADAKISSYGSDHLDDHHNARNPLYVNLFGQDLHPTQTATARLRLIVLDLNSDPSAPLAAHDAFLAEPH